MRISNVSTTLGDTIKKSTINLGKKISRNSTLQKVGNALEMDGVNFNPKIFFAMMLAFVLVPRLKTADERDVNRTKDEVKEILSRDVITMVTLTFAMKALKGVIAKAVSKKNGLVLLNKSTKGMGFMQQAKEFAKSGGGIFALNGKQFESKYTDFKNAENFTNFLKYVDDNGGNVKKVLNFDIKQQGALSKITSKIFPEGLDKLNLKDIIATIKDSPDTQEYLKLLNKKETNPLFNYTRKLNGKLEAASLAFITAFLGFGLPAINDIMTKRRYMGADNEVRPKYENPTTLTAPHYSFENRLTGQEQKLFANFLGQEKKELTPSTTLLTSA